MASNILAPGFRLGKYEVQAHVATGGMGAVYKAIDTNLRRIVALKVLPPQLADRDADLERFRREARLSARLNHRHIVTLYGYEYDTTHSLHYLAMEFINGIDLGQHIELKGRLQPEDARRILIQAAKALAHAFSHGVVHRDIKPSNFLLAQVGRKVVVKLTDLGLALVQGDDDFQVTRTGSTVGTVDYMSPEQARDSRAIDIRSDIYSLGCTGYHMLAGRPPFFEGGLGERVYKHLNEPPPDVRQFNPTVSASFWAVLQKMMAKNPDDRYATPAKLLRALARTPAVTLAEKPTRLARRKTDVAALTPLASLNPATPQTPTDPDAPFQQPRPTPQPEPTSSSAEVNTLVTPVQARAAAAFHERALQVLAEGGDAEYTRQLLDNCLKLDPFNLNYRKTLREVNCKAAGGMLRRLFGSLNILAIKSKMRMARSNRDYRKVLELGEEILARQPADVDTHLEMGGAATELGLHQLARWLLEQGCEQSPANADLVRALARQHEQLKDRKRAIVLWERVLKLAPSDYEARKKIDELSVEDHIARGKYRL
jgi:serine/threonine-protein kinase